MLALNQDYFGQIEQSSDVIYITGASEILNIAKTSNKSTETHFVDKSRTKDGEKREDGAYSPVVFIGNIPSTSVFVETRKKVRSPRPVSR